MQPALGAETTGPPAIAQARITTFALAERHDFAPASQASVVGSAK
jgi:hypothetical protein